VLLQDPSRWLKKELDVEDLSLMVVSLEDQAHEHYQEPLLKMTRARVSCRMITRESSWVLPRKAS
jgi:hypothetical protein